ncbi:MAG: response regulator [Roseiflexaceae bacterium]
MASSILIIDDEPNQRFMLEQALRTLDANVRIATVATGQEALELAASDQPDLIITDYNMPVMNGLNLISELRRRGVGSRIFLITAYSSADLYEAAQQLHVDQYLTKPVPLTLLRRLTSAALGSTSVK